MSSHLYGEHMINMWGPLERFYRGFAPLFSHTTDLALNAAAVTNILFKLINWGFFVFFGPSKLWLVSTGPWLPLCTKLLDNLAGAYPVHGLLSVSNFGLAAHSTRLHLTWYQITRLWPNSGLIYLFIYNFFHRLIFHTSHQNFIFFIYSKKLKEKNPLFSNFLKRQVIFDYLK